MQPITSTFKQIGLLTIALTVALVANFAYGQWADPTAAPTGNNATAPINIGGERQDKFGDMGAFTIRASDDVRSDEYCNYAGDVCFSATAAAAIINAGGGGGSVWTDVNINGTELFDGNCEYRIRVNSVNSQFSSILSSTMWLYMTGVSEQNIVSIAHNSLVSHVRNNSKTIYRVNHANTSYSLSQIQERCPGSSGGGGAGTPPVCAGSNQSLGWNGTDWLCNTMTSGNAAVVREWRDFSGLPARQFVTVYTNTESTPRPLRIRLTNNLNDNQASIFMRVNNGAPWVIMGSAPDVPGQVFNFDVPPGGSYAIDTRWNGNTCVGTSGASRSAGCNGKAVQATNSSVTWEEQLPI